MDAIHEIADRIEGKIGVYHLRLWWATCEQHVNTCKHENCPQCLDFMRFKTIHGVR